MDKQFEDENDLTAEQLIELLNKINEIHNYLQESSKLHQITASSIEALEKQFATIAMGFVEQSIVIEGLINTIQDEDQRKMFHNFVQTRRSAVLKAIEEGQDVLSGVIADLDSSVG